MVSGVDIRDGPGAARRSRYFFSGHAPRAASVTSIGDAAYSYNMARDGHLGTLASLDIDPLFLPDPRAVSAPAWGAELAEPGARPVHFIFRNFRSIRPVGWAHNIAVVVWEFDRLTGAEAAAGNVFRDQKRMLGLTDEVWVASTHNQAVMAEHGIGNIHVIPAAIEAREHLDLSTAFAARAELLAAPAVSFAQGYGPDACGEEVRTLGEHLVTLDGRGARHLTVMNPLDRRKDLRSLLEAFTAHVAQTDPEAVLVVKLATSEERLPLKQFLSKVLGERFFDGGPPLACPRILFTNARLSDAAMTALYGFSDVYVAPTRGEGQNLPLLEAMSAGVLPVSPDHTAMADYMGASVGVVVPSTQAPVPAGLRVAYHQADGLQWHSLSAEDVFGALGRAKALDGPDRAARIALARQVVAAQFGAAQLARRVAGRLAAIEAAAAEAAEPPARQTGTRA
ncbi:MAG: glycosyltransferase [Pseudomonadota bacterium]